MGSHNCRTAIGFTPTVRPHDPPDFYPLRAVSRASGLSYARPDVDRARQGPECRGSGGFFLTIVICVDPN